MLIGTGEEITDGSKHAPHATDEQIQRIERWASAGTVSFSERAALQWVVAYAIPIDLIAELHGSLSARPAPGVRWRGNFYKCADGSSKPHWGQWAPVGDALNFHQPSRFGELIFGV